MMRRLLFLPFALLMCSMTFGQLLIDFNSTTQDTGPNNDTLGGFFAYDAAHEVAADFVTVNYPAFGTSVGVTPSWPDTADNRVQQSIDRTAAFDAAWTDPADSDLSNPAAPVLGLNLVTDWIGIDTRTANGGNGDYDGTAATTPTSLELALSGLPAGAYGWTSAHIDTEHVHGDFQVHVSTDGGANFAQLPDGRMVDASEMGNPDSVATGFLTSNATNTIAASIEGGIYAAGFAADGTNDVIVRFTPLAQDAVHRQLFGINGFVVTAVPEPSSAGLLGVALLSLIGIVRRRR